MLCVLPLSCGSAEQGVRVRSRPGTEPLASGSPVAGGDTGLEIDTWTIGVDESVLAQVLGDLDESAPPLPASTIALWEASGLRIVSVPVEQVVPVVNRLEPMGTVQRQWLGQAFTWTESARGPDMPEGRTLALDAERVRFPPGALRLLVRCWIEPAPAGVPGAPPAAVLRIEMVPQLLESRRVGRDSEDLLRAPTAIAPEQQGQLFSRLLASMAAAPGRAYLIVPARPGMVFRAAERVENVPEESAAGVPGQSDVKPTPRIGEVVRGERGAGGAEAARAGSGSRATLGTVGPPAAAVPTIGEAMLSVPARESAPARRAVIALVPRVPKEFRLPGP